LLGVNLAGDQLRLTPRLPKGWKSYHVRYRYRQTVYQITISRLAPSNKASATQPEDPELFSTGRAADAGDANQLALDGKELPGEFVPLVDDRREHFVTLKVWSPVSAPEEQRVPAAAV